MNIKLWYHQTMANYYGKLADGIYEDPELGMDEAEERMYLIYFNRYTIHRAKVRELQRLQGA